MPRLPCGDLRPLEQDPDGQRGARSAGPPRRHHSRSVQAQSAGDLHNSPTSRSCTEANGSSATSPRWATTTSLWAAQWDVANKVWRAYKVPAGADWWVPHYPGDNMQRPTGPLCDGCHSVNYNVQTHAVTEWNVGCEKCHGPGAAHAAQPTRANIVNPARLDPLQASDVCIQCHSQGRPLRQSDRRPLLRLAGGLSNPAGH